MRLQKYVQEYASKVKDPTSIREHADAVADGEKRLLK